MGTTAETRVYTNRRKPVAGDAKARMDHKTTKRKPYKPKPYEQMQYPGQRVQIDVKVVPRSCIADAQLRLYQYTAIDEYSRYRVLGAYEEQSTFSSADFLECVSKRIKSSNH